MGEVTLLIIILAFLSLIMLSSRYFYILNIKVSTKKLMLLHQFDALTLSYSFEQIIYFHPLPSNIPTIKYAKKKDILIKYDYHFFFSPYLRGIHIYIGNDQQKILLAYLATNHLRFPTLDILMKQEKIDKDSYLKVSTYRLIHPQTLQEVTNEVYHQMKIGRYG